MNRLPDLVAVDVILLLPDRIRDEALRINRTLSIMDDEEKIRLGMENNLPHISIAMATVKSADLPAIGADLHRIVGESLPLALTISGISVYRSSSGSGISSFIIEQSEDLLALHERVMRSLSPYVHGDVDSEMFAASPGEHVAESTLRYVQGFSKDAAFARYSPHVTLGYGEVNEESALGTYPLHFTASRAGLCHVGNHGTCRRLLWSYEQ
jgi:2'-5' RNA ligase